MSGLLVIALVFIVLGSVGHGLRGVRQMLTSLLRPGRADRRYGRQSSSQDVMRITAVVLICVGALCAVGAIATRNVGAASVSAVLLGIGLPILILFAYNRIGIAQPPLYAWMLAAGIIISPLGATAWYWAVIAGEIIAGGLLLLWFDRKDKIQDTFGESSSDAAQEHYSRLRRTSAIMLGTAGLVVLTAVGAAFAWLWLIAAGVVAAVFMVRKVKAMRKARQEEAEARAAEVDRILNTRVEGLDDDDDELLRKYMHDIPTNLRKGERRSVTGDNVRIQLSESGPAEDVDCYVFMLNERSKVRSDNDLIFFGQPVSRDGSVTIISTPGAPGVALSLCRVPRDIQKIVVAFSISVDSSTRTTWSDATVTVQIADDQYTYAVDADGKTRTVSALRLYRHGSGWKVWLTDHRSILGAESLCDEYGVKVA